jgi:glycine/D-amino acid oxidase-like deaminating enzyme
MPGLSPEVRLALGVSEDHWVDNEKLTAAVIEAARRLGVTFHAHCAVNELKVREDRVEAIQAGPAENASAVYSAGCFVLAAGCWSGDLAARIGMPLPLAPCRGQMMEFESPRAIPHVIRAGIHYLVPRTGRRLLLGTTAEYAGFEKTVTAGGMQSILEGAARFAPFLKECVFRRAWAGLRPDTSDHLPILGYSKLRNLALATGHFRHGILLAPLTAQLVSDLVLNRPTGVVPDAYRPGRFA